MTIRTIAASLVLFLVSAASARAQYGEIGGDTIPQYLDSITGFIVAVLVPLVFAVAFVTFIWGIFLYFVAGGANEEKRDQGKQLLIWGIVGLFVMVSVWGLVNILIGTFGFSNTTPPELPGFPASS